MTDLEARSGGPLFMIHGRIRSAPGQGDELAAILSEQELVDPMPGCRLYLVARDPDDADAVWVTEVWEDESDHQASLQLPAVQERIARAMPIIDREGMTNQRLSAVSGVPTAP